MSIVTVARIQHRRGVKTDLPANLNEGELGWCLDTRELFIGNSLAEGGNTQVLTTSSDLSSAIRYTFLSDTSVASQTGASMSQPIIRPLQLQLDDQWVNVKAYGAVGNGIADDTISINRAIVDLYTKELSTNENTAQSRKAIWFPSGVYRISSAIQLYPFVKLVGENCASTQILLTNGGVVDATVAMQTVDSLGQQGANIGNNDAVPPQNITVSNLSVTFQNGDTVVLIQRATDVLFENCVLGGNWTTGSSPQTYGILSETLGSALPTKNIQFSNCVITNVVTGYYTTDEVVNTSFDGCSFYNMFKGVLLENRIAPDPNPNNGPIYTRVANSRFQDVSDYGIQVMSSNPGITSMGNWFSNVGLVSVVDVVYWDTVTTLCTSMGNVYDSGPAVNDQGAANLIVDVQQQNI